MRAMSEDGYSVPVTLKQVELFRDSVPIGQRLRCKIFRPDNGPSARPVGHMEVDATCTVRRKFPHVAETSKGYLQWTLLTIWNRDLLRRFEEDLPARQRKYIADGWTRGHR